MSKRRTYRKFNMSRRRSRAATGTMKVVRWSTRDAGNFCHNQQTGSDTVTEQFGSATFSLGDVQNVGELTGLFDNYRITRVLYRWHVTRDTDFATATGNKGAPVRIVWAHDFNDSTTPSAGQLYQRTGMREIFMNGDDRPVSKWYSLKPASLAVLYEGVAASGYAPKWRQYMDTSDSTVPHYGIKWWVSSLFQAINLRLEAKLFLELKGVS